MEICSNFTPKQSEQRQRWSREICKQEKPLYVSKGKVTRREKELCTFSWLDCYLFTRNATTKQASLYVQVTQPESVKWYMAATHMKNIKHNMLCVTDVYLIRDVTHFLQFCTLMWVIWAFALRVKLPAVEFLKCGVYFWTVNHSFFVIFDSHEKCESMQWSV